jgi:hypothetical protein
MSLVDGLSTIHTDSLGSIFFTLDTNPRGFITLWANQHDIRDMDWGFKFDNTGRECATLGLNLTLVFLPDIYPRYHYTLVIGEHPNHLTALASI